MCQCYLGNPGLMFCFFACCAPALADWTRQSKLLLLLLPVVPALHGLQQPLQRHQPQNRQYREEAELMLCHTSSRSEHPGHSGSSRMSRSGTAQTRRRSRRRALCWMVAETVTSLFRAWELLAWRRRGSAAECSQGADQVMGPAPAASAASVPRRSPHRRSTVMVPAVLEMRLAETQKTVPRLRAAEPCWR